MSAAVQKVLTTIFGSRNERLLKRYRRIVEQVNALEPEMQKKTDAELRARTAELREAVRGGRIKIADVLAEAFAIVRESMDRNIGIREMFNPDQHFDPDQFDD